MLRTIQSYALEGKEACSVACRACLQLVIESPPTAPEGASIVFEAVVSALRLDVAWPRVGGWWR